MCILDRFVFATLAVIFALAIFQQPEPRERIGYDIGAATIAAGGLLISGRHVWLQIHPPEGLGNCGAGFWHLLDRIGVEGAIASALQGSGDCGSIQWTFLGLSIPALTLGLFAILFLLSLVDMIDVIRKRHTES